MLDAWTRAAIYLRASTEMQHYSTSNQAVVLQRYAVEHGYAVVRVYEDDGRSGLDLKGREGLQQLLNDALSPSPEFEVLLVYDVSRWGRFQDVDEGAHYEFLCRKAGIKVVYCAETFENDETPLVHVYKAIKRTMAAEYSRELSEKVRRGKRRLAAAGFSQANPGFALRRLLVDANGAPKGLLGPGQRKAIQSDHVRIVPGPPKEIAIVRKIFRLYANMGMGFTDIARHLNERSILNAVGRPWTGFTVRSVLTNETYIGNLVYGRRTCRLKKIAFNPPEQWVRKEGAVSPIVPYNLFERARRRMFRTNRARTDEFYLRPLEALFKREGYLTEELINNTPGMPRARAYLWRFGGLTNAYQLVGYESPYRRLAEWRRASAKMPDREAMLQKLEVLLSRAGYLTGNLINTEPGMDSFRHYQRAFGDLATAYRLIGYVPQATGPYRPRVKAASKRSPFRSPP